MAIFIIELRNQESQEDSKGTLAKEGLSSADPNKSNCSCELDLGEPVKSIIFNENDLFGLAFLIPRFSFTEGKRVWYGFSWYLPHDVIKHRENKGVLWDLVSSH